MRISCECDRHGLLPDDVEPALLDRNPSGLCEVCGKVPATEICTINALREFATADEANAVCKSCHQVMHLAVYEAFSKQAARRVETEH